MLSISNVTPAQATNYYQKDELYYGEGQVLGVWTGRGSEALGLEGREVETETFRALLEGHMPDGNEIQSRSDGTRRGGLDLTYSAPKSVSIAALVGNDERLAEAHDKAVGKAMNYVENEASQARITQDGVTTIERTGNLVVAQFQHETSRAQDPQLHTHAVVINATQRDDGEWRALDNQEFYRLKMTAGAIYRAELANEVQRLGYEIERTHADGRWELKGFTPEQLEHFSQRRQDIAQELAARGKDDAQTAERVALQTREAKQHVDRTELQQDWKTRAQSVELNLTEITEQARQNQPLEEHQPSTSQGSVHWAVDHVSERQTVFGHHDLVRHALGHGVGNVTYASVSREIANQVKSGELIALRDELGRDHYTTTTALRLEREAVEIMKQGKQQVEPIMAREELSALAFTRQLTKGQEAAAGLILSTGDRFTAVEGKAGTGKTTVVGEVRLIAESQGYGLRGLAPTSAAARVLEQEAHIQSETVARFLSGSSDQEQGSKTVYVIDESSMLSSKQLHGLVSRIEAEGNRAIFIGDRQQLGSIEAGNGFTLLHNHGIASVRMDEILRQKDPIIKQAVEETTQGKIAEAVDRLDSTGRIIEFGNRAERLQHVAQEFLNQPTAARESTLVITGTRADRAELNTRIREGLKEDGSLTGPELKATVLTSKDLTVAQKRQVDSYSVGDILKSNDTYSRVVGVDRNQTSLILETATGIREVWTPKSKGVEVYREETRAVQAGDIIRWTRNNSEADRRNGEIARVISADPTGSKVVVQAQHGERQALNLSDRAHQHWDHGYAATTWSSQGKTAQSVLVHIDSTREKSLGGEQNWYVAISRSSGELTIVTDDKRAMKALVQISHEQTSALAAVERKGNAERHADAQRDDSGRHPGPTKDHALPVISFSR
ncbi:MAG: relaxase domain-containing protein [Nitrospira sp.]|nr:relaxase domain-containing protein [Nitrospira sp.]